MFNPRGFSGEQGETPQENQFMGPNPAQQDNNTSWMAPASSEAPGGDEGAQNPQGAQGQAPSFTPESSVGQPPQGGGGSSDGTALSSAVNGCWGNFNGQNNQWGGQQQQPQEGGWQQPQAPNPNQTYGGGNVGQYMPEGVNMDKWGDPSHATPKYEVLKILSKYPPGPEGLQQARAELEASGYANIVGKDKIKLGGKSGQYAGETIDVGRGFSDPTGSKAWYWGAQGDGPSGQGGNMQSMLGQQQGQQGGFMGGMNPQMIMQYLQQFMKGGSANQMQPNQGRQPFQFGNSQMTGTGSDIAQPQGDMMGGPMAQLQGPNVGMGGPQTGMMPQGSMGIRAPTMGGYGFDPNVRF